MIRLSSQTMALALTGLCLAMPVLAASPAEERLLGCGCEDAQFQSYLPFTRQFAISGIVEGGLGRSAKAAGVPPAATLEVTKALATVVDLDRDVRDGDRFYVRYEQPFTAASAPIEVAHVLWAEIKTAAKGTLALHRFRPANAAHASLWLASGESASPPELEMPLKSITITSGFGMRADPIDQPWGHGLAMGPFGTRRPPALRPSPMLTGAAAVNAPTARGLALGLVPAGKLRLAGFAVGRPVGHRMEMHEGIDLVAALGTPVYAAGDGVVLGAAPNGAYGNWIEIEHADKLATVYGHLSAFASSIVAGAKVKQGELIGFTGNTGRSTGPHLHFEIHVNGRPANPVGNAALKRAQLRGADLQNFRKIVAQDVAEREREAKAM